MTASQASGDKAQRCIVTFGRHGIPWLRRETVLAKGSCKGRPFQQDQARGLRREGGHTLKRMWGYQGGTRGGPAGWTWQGWRPLGRGRGLQGALPGPESGPPPASAGTPCFPSASRADPPEGPALRCPLPLSSWPGRPAAACGVPPHAPSGPPRPGMPVAAIAGVWQGGRGRRRLLLVRGTLQVTVTTHVRAHSWNESNDWIDGTLLSLCHKHTMLHARLSLRSLARGKE